MKLFGLEFSSDRSYTVVDNVATYATKEEKAMGLTKAPQEGILEKRHVPFHQVSNAKTPTGNPIGVFYTGFSVECPTYRDGYSEAEKKEIVEFIQNFIVKPYENQMGVPGILSSSNHSFWKGYEYDLFVGKTFNLANIEHRMELWFACLHGKVVTPISEGSEVVAEATYKIEDFKANRDAETNFLKEKDSARRYIDKLSDNDPDYLASIFRYKGVISPSTTIDADFLRLTAIKVFEGMIPELPLEKMLEVVKEAQSPEGKELIEWYVNIQDLVSNNKVTITDGRYMYKNTVLGNTLNDAARRISDTKSSIDDKVRFEILDLVQDIQLSKESK